MTTDTQRNRPHPTFLKFKNYTSAGLPKLVPRRLKSRRASRVPRPASGACASAGRGARCVPFGMSIARLIPFVSRSTPSIDPLDRPPRSTYAHAHAHVCTRARALCASTRKAVVLRSACSLFPRFSVQPNPEKKCIRLHVGLPCPCRLHNIN